MASGKELQENGAVPGSRTAPRGSFPRGEGTSPKFVVVSVAYIFSMAYRTDAVFRKLTSFLISQDWLSYSVMRLGSA